MQWQQKFRGCFISDNVPYAFSQYVAIYFHIKYKNNKVSNILKFQCFNIQNQQVCSSAGLQVGPLSSYPDCDVDHSPET